MTEKYKDKTPSESIFIRKALLKSVGLSFTEEVYKQTNNIYYSKLTNHLGMSFFGKGTTIEYCLASAYGEAIERVQNLLFIKPNFIQSPLGTIKSVYEIPENILNDIITSNNKYSNKKLDKLSIIPFLTSKSSKYRFEKYKEIISGNTVELPDDIINTLQGSNGMCSGNTKEEALVQGISEILERWVEEYVYDNNLTPPEISKEYIIKNYPRFKEIIKEIEFKTNCTLYFYDYSLGKGYPVIGILLIDKINHFYRKQFGSHPCFEIALERCFTEILQGSGLSQNMEHFVEMLPLNPENNTWDSLQNYSCRIDDHVGEIPLNILLKNSDWQFREWPSFTSNKEMMSFYKSLLSDSGIYVLDRSFLGIPTYKIYIPGKSIINFPKEEYGKDFELEKKLRAIINKEESLTETTARKIINYFTNDLRDSPRHIENIIRPVLLYKLYMYLGEYDDALNQLKLRRSFPLTDCIYNGVILLKKFSLNQVKDILEKFYQKEIVNEAVNIWLPKDNFADIFNRENFFIKMENTLVYKKELDTSWTQEAIISIIYKRMKK